MTDLFKHTHNNEDFTNRLKYSTFSKMLPVLLW